MCLFHYVTLCFVCVHNMYLQLYVVDTVCVHKYVCMYVLAYLSIFNHIRTYVHTYVCTYTVEPLYYGHFGTSSLVLNTEVSSIQRSLNTLQYYTGTQNGVLITEVSTFQRFVLERFHCIIFSICYLYIHPDIRMYVYSHMFSSSQFHMYACLT